jgi:hypothetical protein
MIVKPISDYARSFKTRGRYATGAPPQEMVYAVRRAGSGQVKIGRTSYLALRMEKYEQASAVPVHCVVQLSVRDREAGKLVEAAALKFMRQHHPGAKREWFMADDEAVVALVRHLVECCGDQITMVRGHLLADRTAPVVDAEAVEIDRLIRGHRRRS